MNERAAAEEMRIVDTDLHIGIDPDRVRELLPSHFEDRVPSGRGSGTHGRNRKHGKGWSGERTPENMKTYLLDEYDVDHGIITGSTYLFSRSLDSNVDYALEVAEAHNEWVTEDWLSADDRLKGSVLVAPQRPEASAELIREYGSRPEFVQVVMGYVGMTSYGRRQYWPIYEAAEEMGLPVAIHPCRRPDIAPGPGSASGHTSTYFEAHNALSQTYMGQVNSLVLEGVFVEYPDLTFVCIEGGFGWVPHLMWRMDKNWKGLRDQTPWVERRPSEYVRDHIRFTTQPIEEPDRPEHLLSVFEMMHADETLMFSSDFPHWDGDDPYLALPDETPDDLEREIMYENAAELYDL